MDSRFRLKATMKGPCLSSCRKGLYLRGRKGYKKKRLTIRG